jgi:hypothetical protein
MMEEESEPHVLYEIKVEDFGVKHTSAHTIDLLHFFLHIRMPRASIANPTLNYDDEFTNVLEHAMRSQQYSQPLKRLLSLLGNFQELLLTTPPNIPNNNILRLIH